MAVGVTRRGQVDKRITTILATVITGAWATSFLVDIVASNYDPPPTIHALMMLLAGAAFGGTLRRSGKETST